MLGLFFDPENGSSSSETSVNFYRTTQGHIPGNSALHGHQRVSNTLHIFAVSIIHAKMYRVWTTQKVCSLDNTATADVLLYATRSTHKENDTSLEFNREGSENLHWSWHRS